MRSSRINSCGLRVFGLILCALGLAACAQGGRVAMGNKYAPVAVENVQILFQPPPWPYEQIGIVTSLGAQVASDATVYRELQNQATQLGADAVLIISAGDKPLPGGGYFAAYGRSASGFAMSGGSGFRLQGIALKRISSRAHER